MQNRGWRSVCYVTKKDAYQFHGTATNDLSDRLHQIPNWATGSVEILFSRNNALLASSWTKLLQRIAYLNMEIYPSTSIFLIVYCLLPPLCLLSGQFLVQFFDTTFLVYLLVIGSTFCVLAMLEIKWSGIEVEQRWKKKRLWLIGGTSSHFAAVFLGLLKVTTGIDISFHRLSNEDGDEADTEFAAGLYITKWTSLMILPITIIIINLVAIATAVFRAIYSPIPQWSRLTGGVFFSCLVLAHFYPFAKGLMGRRAKTPTIVCVRSGLITITISLLWLANKPPARSNLSVGRFHFA